MPDGSNILPQYTVQCSQPIKILQYTVQCSQPIKILQYTVQCSQPIYMRNEWDNELPYIIKNVIL